MTWNNPTNAIIYIVSLTWEEVEEVYMVHVCIHTWYMYVYIPTKVSAKFEKKKKKTLPTVEVVIKIEQMIILLVMTNTWKKKPLFDIYKSNTIHVYKYTFNMASQKTLCILTYNIQANPYLHLLL